MAETNSTLDTATLDQWSAPYRNWHYWPDHVIPAEPNSPGHEDFKNTDVPCVYQLPGQTAIWHMSFIAFNGKGYNSFVAESTDLVHWSQPRLAMGFGKQGEFDFGGCVIGAFLYESYDIKAPRVLKKRDGTFWTLYGCYPKQGGYEIDPGYEGVASSEDGLTWKRAKDSYILSVHEPEVGDWEKHCIYQPWLVEHDGTFYNFYNAKHMPDWIEQMGMATSDDLLTWKRHKDNPVIGVRPGGYDEKSCSDGKVFRDGDHWVMFYFGVGKGGAHVMAAFSRDLVHWTAHPDPLYKAGGHPGGLDTQFAHKISLVYNPANETFYLYYCACGNKGRGIGLITSKPLAMGPEAGSAAETKKGKRWSFTPDPTLPNVLILGDSISIGYTLEVRKLLVGKANVFRPLSHDGKGPENCAGTMYGVQNIDAWLGTTKWAVIYFNWGLHDLKHVSKEGGANSDNPADPLQATVKQYSKNLEEIVGKLKATRARLVFATTTPVVPGTTSPLRAPDAPGKYNDAALGIMKANGIAVDDLYSLVLPQLDKVQQPKNVHFTPAGSTVLAAQVAHAIEAALPGGKKTDVSSNAEPCAGLGVAVGMIDKERILKTANATLKLAPITITAFRAGHSEGGPNDFYSNGDYWWPNPKTTNGLPYILRDGQSNPDNFFQHRLAVRNLRDAVAALGAAYTITGDDCYVTKAAELLRVFFIDPTTRMSPHLKYAQAIPGVSSGRGAGIIDTFHLAEVPQAIEAMQKSAAFPADVLEGMKHWFRDYVARMTTSRNGIDEANTKNNHAVAFWLQVATFARFTGDEAKLAECRLTFKQAFVGGQMDMDGSFPAELRRTKPYGYSIFQLDNMVLLCQVLSTKDDDLWTFVLPDGRSVRKAMDYLYPYLEDRTKWPRSPDIQSWESLPAHQPCLLFAGLAFREQKYLELWRRLQPEPADDEARRNIAVTQPILWLRRVE